MDHLGLLGLIRKVTTTQRQEEPTVPAGPATTIQTQMVRTTTRMTMGAPTIRLPVA